MDYGKIYLCKFEDASALVNYLPSWNGYSIPVIYTKYDIKETDMRIKTASFTSPTFYDLTTGKYGVLIQSKYHENFAGLVLDVEYDEDAKLYTYQCQDWSRQYISKFEMAVDKVQLYKVLQFLLSKGGISFSKPTAQQKKDFKTQISGLRALGRYNQALYKGNLYAKNPFNDKIALISRDKSYIEVIRSLVYSRLGYFDVWFNDKGILQIEPISKTDWENTGLMLSDNTYYDRKFKFSTTNAIAGVVVNGTDFTGGYAMATGGTLGGLNLSVFFGNTYSSTNNPSTNVGTQNTTNATNTNNSAKTNKTNKYGNPFMNKPKKVWIDADGGSGGTKNRMVSELKKNGWSVHVSGTGPSYHYTDYFDVKKDYVLVVIQNGFCAGSVREAYSSRIQNVLKKKNVKLVMVFDTAGWTNPNGMKPYRYGDFSKYSAKRAWDDNFSSGDPSIKNVGDFFKKNKAIYCAYPSVAGIMKQFNAGGYFKYKGISV